MRHVRLVVVALNEDKRAIVNATEGYRRDHANYNKDAQIRAIKSPNTL
jgi:hypothetical protein